MKAIARIPDDLPRKWGVPSSAPCFEVSNMGDVCSLTRTVACGRGSREVLGRPRKLVKAKRTGYLKVGNGHSGEWLVHRLVAEVFCAKPATSDHLQVNHKNGNREDNRAENLEWATAAENIGHAYKTLRRNGSAKGKFSGQHPTSKAVIARDTKTGVEQVFACALDAVRALGADSGGISRCCAGRIKTHSGYEWRFAL